MTERLDPYVGLMPYGERDAEWFFGREREVELISANLKASRLTLLYGESGVGKSSVLLAGVLPQLHALVASARQQTVPVVHRGIVLADPPPLAVTMFRDWRDTPLPRLAEAIRVAVIEASGTAGPAPWDGEEPLVDWLQQCGREVRTVLVILDQFEEYFMYHPEEAGPGTLAGELPDVLGDLDLRVNFLLGLREDALSKLDRFKGRIPDLFGNYLRLDYLERDAARVAIEAPVRHFNESVRKDLPPVEVDEELVDAVLDGVRAGRLELSAGRRRATSEAGLPDVNDESAAGRVETPYLQLVMQQLWAAGTANGGLRLTRATLDGLGGAAAIVSSHLSTAMAQLSQEDQAVAADLFGFLVTPSRTKIAHSAEDLAVWAKRPPEQVTAVLRTLAGSERRILRSVPPSSGEQQERYELYHDVLADAVQEWSSRNQERRRLIGARRDRYRRWRRRAAVIAAWVLFAVAAVLGVQWLRGEADNTAGPRGPAERSRDLAGKAREQLRENPELSVLLALRAWDEEATGQAADALRDALSISRVRGAYLGDATRSCGTACAPLGKARQPAPVSLVASGAPVSYDQSGRPIAAMGVGGRVSVAPDGRRIALVDGGRAMLWEPGTGVRRPLAEGRRIAKLAFIGGGTRLLFLTIGDREVLTADARGGRLVSLASDARLVAASADGRYVAISRPGSDVVTVQRIGGEQPVRLRLGGRLTSLSFSPTDPEVLAVGALVTRRDRVPAVRFVRWRADERRPGQLEGAGPSAAYGSLQARFSPDGQRLVVTSDGRRTEVLEVKSGQSLFQAPVQLGTVGGAGPEGRRIVSVEGSLARISSAANGRSLSTLGGHTYPIRSVSFSANGDLVAAGADDGSTRVWDAATGNPMLELKGVGRRSVRTPITYVEFSASGRFLVTGAEDGAVRIWNVSTGNPLTVGPRVYLSDTEFTADGEQIVSVTDRGALLLWRSSDGRRDGQYKALPGPDLYGTQISMESRTVAYARFGRRATIETRDLDGGRPRRIKGQAAPFYLSDDGTRLLILGTKIRVVDVQADTPATVIGRRSTRNFFGGAISPHGDKVLLAGRRPTVVDLSAGDPRRIVLRDPSLRGSLYSGRFNPEGTRLVTAGARSALVWDTATGRVLRRLSGHVGPVTSVAFSPDGTRIITGGQDRTIRLWDSETGEAVGVMEGYPEFVDRVKLDPEGQYVLAQTGYENPPEVSVCVPCLEPAELAELARTYVTRDALPAERRAFDLPTP